MLRKNGKAYASPFSVLALSCGKRAAWRHVVYSLNGRNKFACSCAAVDWRRVDRLVLVCSGNICRSPYAELRARQLGLHAISFGLDATPGSPADAAAIRGAAQRGLDLAAHRSRRSQDILLHDSDLLVAMEPTHVPPLAALRERTGAQVTLHGIWAPKPVWYVPDPYGHSDACFRYCYTLIDVALEGMDKIMKSTRTERDRMVGAVAHASRGYIDG